MRYPAFAGAIQVQGPIKIIVLHQFEELIEIIIYNKPRYTSMQPKSDAKIAGELDYQEQMRYLKRIIAIGKHARR